VTGYNISSMSSLVFSAKDDDSSRHILMTLSEDKECKVKLDAKLKVTIMPSELQLACVQDETNY